MSKKAILISVLIIFSTSSVIAQAFCSLRNPSSQINKFFPTNNGYKTIVGTINDHVSKHVSSVTGLKLHKNEIGRHNLYIVKESSNILGMVHSRSDLSQWGLVETVWAINTDLTIADYDFQRCRSSLKDTILKAEFKSKILGKNIYQLKGLSQEFQKEDSKKEIINLFKVVISAALKAIAVTDNCWSKEINALRVSMLQKLNLKHLYSLDQNGLSKQKFALNAHSNTMRFYIVDSQGGKNKLLFTPVSKQSFKEYKKIKLLLIGE